MKIQISTSWATSAAEEIAVGLRHHVVEMDADAKVYAAIPREIDVDAPSEDSAGRRELGLQSPLFLLRRVSGCASRR